VKSRPVTVDNAGDKLHQLAERRLADLEASLAQVKLDPAENDACAGPRAGANIAAIDGAPPTSVRGRRR